MHPFSKTVPYMPRQRVRNAVADLVRPATEDAVFANAEQVDRAAADYLQWAASSRESFFLFLNYMDAHAPYLPPADFADRFEGRDRSFRWNRRYCEADWRGGVEGAADDRRGARPPGVAGTDGAIAYVDHRLGLLLDRLRRLGLYDNTLIVITSDHGEAFGEHDFVGHGTGLFENQVRVPLVVDSTRGTATASTVHVLVGSVDLFPTILEVSGLPVPAGLDGRSLLGIQRDTRRWVAAESFSSPPAGTPTNAAEPTDVAIFDGTLKLIRNVSGRQVAYDVGVDPAEQVDIASRLNSPEAWQARLGALALERRPASPTGVDAQTLERLRSLWLRPVAPSDSQTPSPDTRNITAGSTQAASRSRSADGSRSRTPSPPDVRCPTRCRRRESRSSSGRSPLPVLGRTSSARAWPATTR